LSKTGVNKTIKSSSKVMRAHSEAINNENGTNWVFRIWNLFSNVYIFLMLWLSMVISKHWMELDFYRKVLFRFYLYSLVQLLFFIIIAWPICKKAELLISNHKMNGHTPNQDSNQGL
jgi:hypothetical protein